jgi:hypothetical protein
MPRQYCDKPRSLPNQSFPVHQNSSIIYYPTLCGLDTKASLTNLRNTTLNWTFSQFKSRTRPLLPHLSNSFKMQRPRKLRVTGLIKMFRAFCRTQSFITLPAITHHRTASNAYIMPCLCNLHPWRYCSIIFEVDTTWECVVNFALLSMYTRAKRPPSPLYKRLGGPQCRSGRCGMENSLASAGN